MENLIGLDGVKEFPVYLCGAGVPVGVAEELRRLGWSAEDLVRRRKNDPGKLAIAVRLRRETTLSIKAIAARVQLGTYNTANARLHGAMREGFVVTPSITPSSFAFLISSMFAVSIKNFISAPF